MKKKIKKIWYEIYWRRVWWFFYSRRTTWGVQWYKDASRYSFGDLCIEDKVFFRKKSAEKFWNKIKGRVRERQVACLWEIEKGDYKIELETVIF